MTLSKDLTERSPLRVLDESIRGGLEEGGLGVVCAGPGAGKSAFLVSVALDDLMRGNQVLHVAVDQSVDRVRNYYDEILAEVAREEDLEDTRDVREQVDRHRHIHTFQDRTFSAELLDQTLELMRGGTDLRPDLIVVDGFDWSSGTDADLIALKNLAKREHAKIWMSAKVDRHAPVSHPKGYPDPVAKYEAHVDVLLRLVAADGVAHINVLKDRDNPEPHPIPLDLDPTTLRLVKVKK